MTQFFKFCLIGGLGFAVDALSFYCLIPLMPEVMLARLGAFWIAVLVTWLGNRFFTFALNSQIDAWRQGLKHLLSSHFSGLLNLLCFYTLNQIAAIEVAFVGGIFVGTGVNYLLATKLVFCDISNKITVVKPSSW